MRPRMSADGLAKGWAGLSKLLILLRKSPKRRDGPKTAADPSPRLRHGLAAPAPAHVNERPKAAADGWATAKPSANSVLRP